MKITLLCAFVLAALLTAVTFQVTPADGTCADRSDQGALKLTRKEPEPPAYPDFDGPERHDRSSAA